MESLKIEVENAIKERFSGPLGYVSLSFILYHWSWIYFFIFSNLTAEEKINSIQHNFEYTPGILIPLAAGVSLAVISPFLRTMMVYLTSLARKLEDTKKYDIARYLDNYIKNKQAEASLLQLEIERNDGILESLREEKIKLTDDIKLTQESIDALHNEHLSIVNSINQAKNESQKIEVSLSTLRASDERYKELLAQISEKHNEISNLKNLIRNSKLNARWLVKMIENLTGGIGNLGPDDYNALSNTKDFLTIQDSNEFE
ncbi:hypothetical protein MXM81_11035 [Serratia plymuthica]|uniref:hypothetical protein n=1 Tax=Serratia plymuthica TaxID=82996 RepID=UPI002DBB402F|nr:hypothetical protein [Serratia plymuthica]MEB6539621.1 hypothetical protein [Serratia plymuthica]